jgi:phytoene dehydrogenase-like protein
MLLSATNRSLAGGHAVKGGPPALIQALMNAAESLGVEIRTSAPVARIEVANERTSGVTLASGEHLDAGAVISSVDPKRTFLTLCEADHLPPEFLWRIKHYRSRGTLAKINLALAAAPTLRGLTPDMLTAPVRIAPDLDYLERAFDHAKYGRWSPHPWIEFTAGSSVSMYVQYVPHAIRDHAFADAAIDALDRCVPGLKSQIVSREVFTPRDLEDQWGLTGGHIFHGELSLDQFFTMRPLLGFGQYQTPIRGVYLCGSGSHPGTGLTGGSGFNAAREIARVIS